MKRQITSHHLSAVWRIWAIEMSAYRGGHRGKTGADDTLQLMMCYSDPSITSDLYISMCEIRSDVYQLMCELSQEGLSTQYHMHSFITLSSSIFLLCTLYCHQSTKIVYVYLPAHSSISFCSLLFRLFVQQRSVSLNYY